LAIITKLALIVCVAEYVLAALFALAFWPLRSGGLTMLPSSPGFSTFIVFGGYCVLAVGFVLYCIGAIGEIFGKAKQFWRSSLPLIAALPILVWGIGKLQLAAGWGIALLAFFLCILVMVIVVARSPVWRWSALPAVLLVVCLPIADWRLAWLLYVPIGALLVTAPIVLASKHGRAMDTAAST
jgi:hypothetical protein